MATILSVNITGAAGQFVLGTASELPLNLSSAAPTTLSVRFNPTAEGTFHATLFISWSSQGVVQTTEVSLSGHSVAGTRDTWRYDIC